MLRLIRTSQLLSSFCSYCSRHSRAIAVHENIMTENENTETSQSQKRPSENQKGVELKKQKIEVEPFVRIKRKNYAMMLSYLGKNYFGMQRNPGCNTVEEELIKAMLKAELITSEAFETIQNIHFQRAARTDKGVSAVRQVVSLKLPDNPCKDSINKNLPEDIRVFAIKRVTKGFNSKSQCDARTYSYTLPTFALAPENLEHFKETAEYNDLEKRAEQLSIIDGKPFHEYRLPQERKEKLSELLKVYEGTHNFHNFTSKVLPLDPRARRYIISFVAEEPFVENNMEFITLKVKGQSFMLHQIRKMVAMVIGVIRGIVPKEEFEQTVFEQAKYDITIAPSLGLMLNIVHYDYYNNRYGSDGMHETLDWAECDQEIIEFEKKIILKYVLDTELKEKPMFDWLVSLQVGAYGIRDESKDQKDDTKQEKLSVSEE